MNEKLNSYREVEEVLGSLSRQTYPADRMGDLMGLIWPRIERPVVPMLTVFRSVFATVFILTVLGGLFWGLERAGQLPFQKPLQSRFLEREIDVHGIIVGRTGTAFETRKLEVHAGDLMVTDDGSSVTVYLPAAGYLYLPQGTNLLFSEAKRNSESGRMSYRLTLSEGSFYAALPQLEPGSLLIAQTQLGQIHVTGTDFLLGVNKDGSTSVSVLSGSVEAGLARKTDETQPVKSGSRALLLSDADGTLLISELTSEEQIKLKQDFEQIFGEIVAHERDVQKKAKERNIKILWRKDE